VWGQVVLGAAALRHDLDARSIHALSHRDLARSLFRIPQSAAGRSGRLYLQTFLRQRYERRAIGRWPVVRTIFYQTFGRRFFIVPLISSPSRRSSSGPHDWVFGKFSGKGFGSNNGVAVAAISGRLSLRRQQRHSAGTAARVVELRRVQFRPAHGRRRADGMALSEVASPAVGGLVAFGLGPSRSRNSTRSYAVSPAQILIPASRGRKRGRRPLSKWSGSRFESHRR